MPLFLPRNLITVISCFAAACSASKPGADATNDSRPAESRADKSFVSDGPNDGPIEASLADQGASCDAASYTNRCEGSIVRFCANGVEQSFDCASTLNKICVELSGGPQCLVSEDTSQCATGTTLKPCVDLSGQAHALTCIQESSGALTSFYARCPTGYCIPSLTQPGQGSCSGAPCVGEYRECVGDELHICEAGSGLTVYDCAKQGEICYTSSLGNGWASCHAPSETPCDPQIFTKTCTSETAGVNCLPKLGYTSKFDCSPSGLTCCYAVDAGLNASNNCC